eukprot:8929556-Karenia_brevis.AAC.1
MHGQCNLTKVLLPCVRSPQRTTGDASLEYSMNVAHRHAASKSTVMLDRLVNRSTHIQDVLHGEGGPRTDAQGG